MTPQPKSGPKLPKWRILRDQLYAPDCKRIEDLIPQLVSAIKSLPAQAANDFLLAVLLSPAARVPRNERVLKFVDGMRAGEAAQDFILDAAGAPRDRRRETWRAELSRRQLEIHQQGKSLNLREFIDSLASDIGVPGDEAIKTRMQRARASMGISRPRGRPKGTLKKSAKNAE